MAKIKVTCECGHTAEYDESEIHSHRLICGDSTDVAVIDRLMDGVKAELLLTDPPYGINVVRGGTSEQATGRVGGVARSTSGTIGGAAPLHFRQSRRGKHENTKE